MFARLCPFLRFPSSHPFYNLSVPSSLVSAGQLLLYFMMADKKPAVLIIGGLGASPFYSVSAGPANTPQGFIGRHLALYIHENNLASEVRLVDKVLPQLAWLAPEFQEACSKEKFVQADASRERKWRPFSPTLDGQPLRLVIHFCRASPAHFRPSQWRTIRLRDQLRR